MLVAVRCELHSRPVSSSHARLDRLPAHVGRGAWMEGSYRLTAALCIPRTTSSNANATVFVS